MVIIQRGKIEDFLVLTKIQGHTASGLAFMDFLVIDVN